jgi:hypothetical protein
MAVAFPEGDFRDFSPKSPFGEVLISPRTSLLSFNSEVFVSERLGKRK